MTRPKINLLAVIQSATATMAKNQTAHSHYRKAEEELVEAECLFQKLHLAAENALTALEGEEDSVQAEHQEVIHDLIDVLSQLPPPVMPELPRTVQETPGALSVASKLLEATRTLVKEPTDAMARQRARETIAQAELAIATAGPAVGLETNNKGYAPASGEEVIIDLAAGTVTPAENIVGGNRPTKSIFSE